MAFYINNGFLQEGLNSEGGLTPYVGLENNITEDYGDGYVYSYFGLALPEVFQNFLDGESAYYALLNQDPSVSANSYAWTDGDLSITATGPALDGNPPQTHYTQLSAAIFNNFASESSDEYSIVVTEGGAEVARLVFGSDQTVLEGDGVSIVLDMDMDGANSVLGLIDGFPELASYINRFLSLDVLPSLLLPDAYAATVVDSLGLEGVSYSVDGAVLFEMQRSATDATITAGDASVQLTGDFASVSMAEILFGYANALSGTDGAPLEADGFFDGVHVPLTSARGTVFDDVYVNIFNFDGVTSDVIVEGRDGASEEFDSLIFEPNSDWQTVQYLMGNGDDSMRFDGNHVLENAIYSGSDLTTSYHMVSGGEGWDQLRIIDDYYNNPYSDLSDWDNETQTSIDYEVTSSDVTIDFSVGRVSSEIELADSLGNSSSGTLYEIEFSGIEEISSDISGDLTIVGDSSQNIAKLRQGPESLIFVDPSDGDGDVLDLSRIRHPDEFGGELLGFSIEYLQEYMSVERIEVLDDVTYKLSSLIDGESVVVAELTNVEYVKLRTEMYEEGESYTMETAQLYALMNGEVITTEGDDDIFVSQSDADVDGQEGWDSLELISADSDGVEITFSGETSGTIDFTDDGVSSNQITFENIERVVLRDIDTDIDVIGAQGRQILTFDGSGPEGAVLFDGGDGDQDELQLHRVWHTYVDEAGNLFETRITLDVFSSQFQLVAVDGFAFAFDFVFYENGVGNGTGATVGRIIDVEYIRFAGEDGADDVTMSVSDLIGLEPPLPEATEGDDDLWGTDGDDSINGLGGDDYIEGRGGNDTINGGAGSDGIESGAGDDVITTGTGQGWVDAGAGDDYIDASDVTGWGYWILPGLGNDTIVGNQALYSASEPQGSSLVYNDLSDVGGLTIVATENGSGTVVSGDGSVNDTFTFMNRFGGSMDADAITGGMNTLSDAEWEIWEGLQGYAGNDTIIGGGGFDEILYHEINGNWAEDLDEDGVAYGGIVADLQAGTVIDSWGDTDTVSDVDAIRGSMLADSIQGSTDVESFGYRGLRGNDTIIGAVGGWDVLDYRIDYAYGGWNGIDANLISGTVIDGFGDTDTVSEIERVNGTGYDDVMLAGEDAVKFVGYDGDDQLAGGAGDDTLSGGAGDDELSGSEGNDLFFEDGGYNIINGGDGVDRLVYEGLTLSDVILQQVEGGWRLAHEDEINEIYDVEFVDFGDQTLDINVLETALAFGVDPDAIDETAFDIDLTEASEVTTGALGDTVGGSEESDTVESGLGADVVDAGGGDDEINAGDGSDNVQGGDGDDTIFSSSGDDTVNGGAGADQGVLLGGDNTVEEDDAPTPETPEDEDRPLDDFYCGGSGNDSIMTGGGHDLIIADVTSDYFVGNDTVMGGTGDDLIQAGYGSDTFIFRSGDGNDVIARGILDAYMVADDYTVEAVMAELDSSVGADFQVGVDVVKLEGFDAATLNSSNILTHIENNANGDAVLDTGTGTITFVGVDAGDFSADDFVF